MKYTLKLILVILAVAAGLRAAAYQNDYGQDVQINTNPSPLDPTTGSSLNQFGQGQSNSQVDNYVNQDEQINLDRFSGTVKVLRTNQKSLVNKYVTAIVPLNNVNPRELRGLARTLCRKEGGDADVLQDKVSKQFYLVVVCPDFELPYVMRTLQGLDENWVQETRDGSWYVYYIAKNRDVRSIMETMQYFRSPDGQWDFDDAQNAMVFFDQPNVEPLFKFATSQIDIPPSQMMLDVAIYEVNTQNDLDLGFDFISWKNGPGQDLFRLVTWDFGGDNPGLLFPGNISPGFADSGCYTSYNFFITTAYLDFLEVKGRARLLTRSTLTAKSGTVGELAAVDQVAAFVSETNRVPVGERLDAPVTFNAVYDFYRDEHEDLPSLEELAALAPAEVMARIDGFLSSFLELGVGGRKEVADQLEDYAKDGAISERDLKQVVVPLDVTLRVFQERTLRYLRQGQVGVLLSILPYVGLESAELSLALDVSDVTGYAPNGTPTIEHRYVSSDVSLRDGQPLVLSGLRRSNEVKTSTGVPWLRDLPWVGYLFGREATTRSQKELVVILTPRFQLCPTDVVAPPLEVEAALQLVRSQATGEDPIPVPQNALGFDQWLLGNR